MIKFRSFNPSVYIIADILKDSPLDDLLFKASLKEGEDSDGNPRGVVLVSLNDRKIYVGKVISLGEPNESEGPDQEISIVPIMSGYRDKDNLKVSFTTEYEAAGEDIYLTIRQDQILAATEFSFKAYENFTQRGC